MGEEFGAPVLGFRPVFSRLITNVGAGPEGAPSPAGTDCSTLASQVRLSLLGGSPPPPGA